MGFFNLKKNVTIELDMAQLKKQESDKQILKNAEVVETTNFDTRSTVFSLGKDPRVGKIQGVPVPELMQAEILKDGLDNPYVEVTWRLPRKEIDSGRVVGFNVFKRRVSGDEIKKTASSEGSQVDLSTAALSTEIGFANVSKKIPRKGKFSEEKKAINSIKKGLVPLSLRNPMLALEQETARTRSVSSGFNAGSKFPNPFLGSEPLGGNSYFENLVSSKLFVKLQYVDYSSFVAKEKKKLVHITDRNFVTLNVKDKNVGYGEVFEYFVVAVTELGKNSSGSEIVRLRIDEFSPIRPPKQILTKQDTPTSLKLSILIDGRDLVGRAFIYRKSEDQVIFRRIASIVNRVNKINFTDNDVRFGEKYTYRVFLESIYGTFSEPKEITTSATVQRVTAKSRSNTFKIPVLNAIQDQNSDFIKVIISPNDPNVSYYELERRDLTIRERKFSVPSKENTGYGGDGWETNKFFVKKAKGAVETPGTQRSPGLNTKIELAPIEFLDDTVAFGHIYEYRAKGRDLYGNTTPHTFSTVVSSGKRVLRAPINLKSDITRSNPFRVKVSWEDDNLSQYLTKEQLLAIDRSVDPSNLSLPKFLYRVERRRSNEIKYEEFPVTENKFIVDEVATTQPVTFQSKIAPEPPSVKQPSVNPSLLPGGGIPVRPFGFPDFLNLNEVYFYRVSVIDQDNVESNFTQEIKVVTFPDISDPINFKAVVSNTKVRPLVVKLTWENEPLKFVPDRWSIERRVDVDNDSFIYLGTSYLSTQFFDRQVDPGKTYIYRIRSIDNLGRESNYFEAKMRL